MVEHMSRILGWFSAALGSIQLAVPSRLLGAIGLRPIGRRVTLTRLVGLRELSVVPGLLASKWPVGWLAARVVGDLMDLVLLVRARGARDSHRGPLTLAIGAVTAVTVADVLAAVAARREQARLARHAGRIVRAVTVNRPAEELYRFWRDLENLPRVMPHLESVEARGDRTSHWVASSPLGVRVEWDAEIVDDRPNERVSWRSVEGSDVHSTGSVRFEPAPGGRGTEVVVEMEYDVPGGPIGSVIAILAGEEPKQQVSDALRRFKQVMETGEPILSAATANGRKVMQRPAQPPSAQPPSAQEHRELVAEGSRS